MVKLHILGSGNPTPAPDRFGSSYVIEIGDRLVMFDCGPAATQKLVKSGLWPTSVGHLFFTHHHFDHNIDYPCFLLCRWDQNSDHEGKPLTVAGPKGTARLTTALIGKDGAFALDINARIESPVSQRRYQLRGGVLPRPWPQVNVQDVSAGWTFSGPDWNVKAGDAQHVQPYLESLAWRFESDETSIVFTGDTELCGPVRDLAQNADVLVAMCGDHQSKKQADNAERGSMGTLRTAQLAQESGAKNLVLVHSAAHFVEPDSIRRALSDIGSIYQGKVWVGREQLVLEF